MVKRKTRPAYWSLNKSVAQLLIKNKTENYTPQELLDKWDILRAETDKAWAIQESKSKFKRIIEIIKGDSECDKLIESLMKR
jgi:hypothetical protein